jgi:hypothetical protein
MSQLIPFATRKIMAKPAPTHEHESLLNAVAQYPQGARIDQIEAKLVAPPTRRTLQRWMNELIAQHRLHKEGQGRATRYLPGQIICTSSPETQQTKETAHSEIRIPLSAEARAVLAHIRQPVQKRIPVGYNRPFLDDYRPNASFYLSESIRAELLAHGQAVTSTEPAGTYARQIAHRLLIDLAWNSSRLEGNTYSLLETERLLSVGEAAQGKNALEAQMILNHKEAIEFLIASAQEIGFNRYTVLNLHALLSDNLLEDPTASGRLRTIPVGIDECFQQVLDTAAAIENPFEQAFFSMVHLPYLQPFDDVNKRVSRLAANIPLIRRNLCPLSFVDVPQPIYISAMLGIYELNRIELLRDVFVWAYKSSCSRYSAVRQSLGEPDPFRTQYRERITEVVADVVRQGMNKSEAVAFIQRFANEKLPAQDRERFVEVVETQLLSLHLGSMARYRLRPSEFDAWQVVWQ